MRDRPLELGLERLIIRCHSCWEKGNITEIGIEAGDVSTLFLQKTGTMGPDVGDCECLIFTKGLLEGDIPLKAIWQLEM